jgi:hypothetical protein
VRARDLATPANVSAYNSPTVSATPLASAPKVKWHPGIYVVGGDVMGLNGAAGYTTAKLDSVSASGAVGWKQLVTWGSIETSKGVYDFSKLDTLLAACKARNLRMAIEVGFGWYTTESIATATSNGQFPAYLATDTYAPASGNALLKNSIEIITRGWVSGVMDRWIALWQAIGAHYDSDSSVEDVQSTEFTTNATGDADYSVSAYLTQLERFAATVPASFPHTMTTMVANSGLDNSSTQFQGLIAYMSSHRISLGDHDMRPDKWPPSLSSGRGTPGQRCAQGLDGCPDYRGVMAITSNDEAINLGGSHTPSGQNMSTLLSDMFGWTQTYLHLDHLYITYKDYTLAPNPPTDIYWNTIQDGNPDIYDFIHAGGHTVTTACPSQYTGGCNTN